MRYIIKKHFLLVLLTLCCTVQINAQKKFFIRIYPIGSSAAIKGFYSGHTDSALIIQRNHQPDTIFYSLIQQIKTRRSTGHNILISALTGTLGGTAIGLIAQKDSPPPDPNCQLCNILNDAFAFTPAEAAAGGAVLGAVAGTIVGTITGLTKRKETLIVGGNFRNWNVIRTRLGAWPVYMPGTDNK